MTDAPTLTTAEAEFLAAYDARSFPPVAVAVDVVALTIRAGELCVLLVRRGVEPFRGSWALPGGFVAGDRDETLADTAIRELVEETGLRAAIGPTDDPSGIDPSGVEAPARIHLEQLGTYGDPHRDPRLRVVSVAYLAFAPDLPEPSAGSDAERASWVPLADLALPNQPPADGPAGLPLAFDHARILADGLERARDKLEWSPLATAFVTETFTIADLRSVYETVWGTRLHSPNFRRKVLSVPGLVEPVGATTATGGPRGGRRAHLYRRGNARILHPALLRPDREGPR